MGQEGDKRALVGMISSTARDLPAHREKVMHACTRLSLLSKMMEHLPASPDDAIAASLKLVRRGGHLRRTLRLSLRLRARGT